MKILITGATGLVGRALSLELIQRGHSLHWLCRQVNKLSPGLQQKGQAFAWDGLSDQIPRESLRAIDAVIHLAGEPVASGLWTAAKKNKIYRSRVQSTHALSQALEREGTKVAVWLNASAIGYYGDRGAETLSESSASGEGFLAEVCRDWEQALWQTYPVSSRQIALRTGLVLARPELGGLLARLLPAYKLGLGARLGSGQQWMSWIHLQDLVKLYAWALENEAVRGALNAVSPFAVNQDEWHASLAQAVHRPAFLAAPEWALRAALGELSQILLASQKVSAEKALSLGFRFAYPGLPECLQNLSGKGEAEPKP